MNACRLTWTFWAAVSSPLVSMYCRRATRSLVSEALSWVMSLIQLLRSISPPRLFQPVRARMVVRSSTKPKPRPSFRLTLILPNQLFIEFLQERCVACYRVAGRCCFWSQLNLLVEPVSALTQIAERFLSCSMFLGNSVPRIVLFVCETDFQAKKPALRRRRLFMGGQCGATHCP